MSNAETLQTDVVVLGAGVVGLAVAAAISKKTQNIVLMEQHGKFGQETSSRNSEVVHSGIYYPKDSLKTKLCIRGRELLYAYCEKWQVPFRKTGKFLVATAEEENAYLESI